VQSLEEAAEAVVAVVVAVEFGELRVDEVEHEVVCEQLLVGVGETGANEGLRPAPDVQRSRPASVHPPTIRVARPTRVRPSANCEAVPADPVRVSCAAELHPRSGVVRPTGHGPPL
jgi:hypothetical protein